MRICKDQYYQDCLQKFSGGPAPLVPTGLGKPKLNPLIYSPPLFPRCPEPNTYTSHTLHQLLPCTTLIPSMSAALDTIPEPHVPPTCHALTTTTPPYPTPAFPSPSDSQHTHMQHRQQYTHHSHNNHIKTTSQTYQIRLQTQHKDTNPAVKVR